MNPSAAIVVRVMPKTPAHPYYGVGSPLGYVVVGAGEGATLTLARGRRYAIDVSTGGAHPLYLSTSPKGGMGAPGALTAPIADGVVTIDTSALPATCYYECALHDYMGGAIVIADDPQQHLYSPPPTCGIV